jgi:hypothetical protein
MMIGSGMPSSHNSNPFPKDMSFSYLSRDLETPEISFSSVGNRERSRPMTRYFSPFKEGFPMGLFTRDIKTMDDLLLHTL